MKTIEQEAKEYAGCSQVPEHCSNCHWIPEEYESCSNRLQYKAFLSGYETAFEWISINDSVPELTMKTMRNNNYTYTIDPVLVKTSNGRYAVTKRKQFLDHGWTWMGSHGFDQSITHWRKIIEIPE